MSRCLRLHAQGQHVLEIPMIGRQAEFRSCIDSIEKLGRAWRTSTVRSRPDQFRGLLCQSFDQPGVSVWEGAVADFDELVMTRLVDAQIDATAAKGFWQVAFLIAGDNDERRVFGGNLRSAIEWPERQGSKHHQRTRSPPIDGAARGICLAI